MLENALQLFYKQQRTLIKILQSRQHENHRVQMAIDAQQTLADFHAGKFHHQSTENAIAILRQSLVITC